MFLLVASKASLVLTVAQAEQLLQERNPQLQMGLVEVDEARASLQQERLWENPEVDVLYNVYNPLTRRYFDPGREGEIDIAVEQPISIGGQRRARIRKAQSAVEATEYRRQWEAWLLRMDLHRTLADIYFLQEKTEAFDTEIASADRIITAWRRQAEQGNVAPLEVARMEALKLRLLSEQNEVAECLAERERDLAVMLGSPPLFPPERGRGVKIVLQLNFLDSIGKLAPLPWGGAVGGFLMAKHHETEATRHDLRLQRANALPRLSVKGEYDKNGNICRNFWGVGVSLSVPLFNRNQGSIRQAASALERQQLEEQTARRQAEADVALCYDQLQRRQQLLAEARRMTFADWSPDGLERQLLARNLSLVEFIDLYDAWREARIQLIDAQCGVAQAAVNLNEKAGAEVIPFK